MSQDFIKKANTVFVSKTWFCVWADEKTDFGQFYSFDTVTLFPIDTQLVAVDLLTKSERDWLNAYHVRVYEKLSQHLNDVEKTWLKEKCKEI